MSGLECIQLHQVAVETNALNEISLNSGNAEFCFKRGRRNMSLHSAETAEEVSAMAEAEAEINAWKTNCTPLHVDKPAEMAKACRMRVLY